MMAKYCKKENLENRNSHDKPVVASGTVYRSDSKTLATLALVYSIPSWLVWAEIELVWCMLNR